MLTMDVRNRWCNINDIDADRQLRKEWWIHGDYDYIITSYVRLQEGDKLPKLKSFKITLRISVPDTCFNEYFFIYADDGYGW